MTYAPGTLKAVGIRGDRAVAESVLTTAGKAAALRLQADRTVLHADSQDLAFVTVEAVDAAGRWQPDARQQAHFSISGPGTIIAVGNGDGQSAESYQGDHRSLFQGRALVVIRTSREPGAIRLTAEADGLDKADVNIEAHSSDAKAELAQ